MQIKKKNKKWPRKKLSTFSVSSSLKPRRWRCASFQGDLPQKKHWQAPSSLRPCLVKTTSQEAISSKHRGSSKFDDVIWRFPRLRLRPSKQYQLKDRLAVATANLEVTGSIVPPCGAVNCSRRFTFSPLNSKVAALHPVEAEFAMDGKLGHLLCAIAKVRAAQDSERAFT
jgi:hypothetical protein